MSSKEASAADTHEPGDERPPQVAADADGVDWSRELLAGATIFAVLVPSALAYSSIVGVSPISGLVGVPLALIAYAIFGGSAITVVGADAAVSVVVASAVISTHASDSEYASAVLILSLLVGGVYLLFRLLRLGWIADAIPQPVLNGFVQGLVWVTIAGQLGGLLGQPPGQGGHLYAQLRDVVTNLSSIQVPTAITGILALAALLLSNRFGKRIPSALIVIVAAGIAYAALGLKGAGVAVVGEPTGSLLPTSLTLPSDLSTFSPLVPAAVAIVVLGFTEHLGAVAMVGQARGERLKPNRELLGLGAANVAVGLGGSYAVTGALSKTSVAIKTGARTRWANLTAAGLAVVAALALRPLFDYLPKTVLAAIVIWAMVGMIDVSYLRWLYQTSRREFTVYAVAFFGVMLIGVMPAVVVATVLALGLLAHRIARPPIVELGRDEEGSWHLLPGTEQEVEPVPGFTVIRWGGPVVFPAARVLADSVRDALAAPDETIIVIDASAVSALDTTGLRSLIDALDNPAHRDREVRFAGEDDDLWAVMRRGLEAADLPMVRRYYTVDAAIADGGQPGRGSASPG